MWVNQTEYTVIKLLGRGKGGYSYLVEKEGKQYVLKQIHHEPCDYYTFGNKIEAERCDYEKLVQAGIPVPKMLDIDIPNERILKEYIHGPTVYALVKNDEMEETYLQQVRQMASKAEIAGLNIDYFPTNFVAQDGKLCYVDYECNPYMKQWSFETWGVQYWSKTKAFMDYVNQQK